MMQSLNARGAQGVAAMNENARNAFSDVVLKATELAHVKTSNTVI